jgi:hypothetical protein
MAMKDMTQRQLATFYGTGDPYVSDPYDPHLFDQQVARQVEFDRGGVHFTVLVFGRRDDG